MRKLLKKRNNRKLKHRFNNYFMYELKKGLQELSMNRRYSRKSTEMDPIWEKSNIGGWSSLVRYKKKSDGRIKTSTLRHFSLTNPFA